MRFGTEHTQSGTAEVSLQDVPGTVPALLRHLQTWGAAGWSKIQVLPRCPSIPREHCGKAALNVTLGGLGSAFTSLWEQRQRGRETFPLLFLWKGEPQLPFSSGASSSPQVRMSNSPGAGRSPFRVSLCLQPGTSTQSRALYESPAE